MGLYERLAGSEAPKLPVHAFGSGVQLWLTGDVTNAEMISTFALSQDEQTTMLQIKATYDGKSNAANKAAFLMSTHSVFCLVERGMMNKARAATILGITA